ncbi:hypothetical protein CANARDRAFT_28331 [[Candida] arabinofermentans NRRL YB-2248]|uniref:N-acetyltransferase domain-containing protein n=1 Tax=[Candida] arabinofermentans NRRL YB-2248 TaxID=983967 RepID=A0A1E4T1C7_9ASCO|nr:hypothetical protein CANARDRAFT_28331 [[Candida] arabinofermentans NRRL YB-2248]
MSSVDVIVLTITQALSLEQQLISILNRGYNKPRYKYGLILSPRMKHSLLQDLIITDPDNSYITLCLAPKTDDNSPLISSNIDASTLTSKLIEQYPIGTLSFENINLINGLQVHDKLEELKSDNNLEFRVLGTIGLKKYNNKLDEFEVTAFTSFYPKVAKLLMSVTDSFAKNNLKANYLWVDVIVQHDLVEYYQQYGYVFIKEIECKIDKNTNHVIGSNELETGVMATNDFKLALLNKRL